MAPTAGAGVAGPPAPRLPAPHLPDPRTVSTDVHRHLRRLIVDGVLAPGAVLSQAELARAFGTSRTPLREAFRMLQEEGLIAVEANQRAVVRALDPGDLDHLYGVRVVLESLGAQLTAGRLSPREVAAAEAELELMARSPVEADPEAWTSAHRRFHLLCVARAGEPLRRVIASYGERSERYLRALQTAHPQAFRTAHAEHRGILAALVAGDAERAGALMGQHLSRTSLTVLADVRGGAGPGDAEATRRALRMADPAAAGGPAPA